MKRRMGLPWIAAVCLLAGSVLQPAAPALAAEEQKQEGKATVQTVEEVLRLLMNLHLSGPSEDELARAAIRGMTEQLDDPYTRYYSNEDMNRLSQWMLGSPVDPGFHVILWKGGVYVSDVFPDSPADKAGMKRGDRIVAAEGKAIPSVDPLPVLRGSVEGKAEKDSVRFRVERDGTVAEFSLTLAPYVAPTVLSQAWDDVGYIRITMFTATSGTEFIRALEDLQQRNIRSLILDIRDNPGGVIAAMQQIAGAFVGEETVLYGKDSGGKELPFQGTHKQVWDKEKDVYLLINGYSASASDMLAAALKDHGAAVLVGANTYGKGISQNYMPVMNGPGMLSVTTTEYLSPEHKPFHKIGVAPDVEASGQAVPLIEALRLAGAGRMELSFRDFGWHLNGLRMQERLETAVSGSGELLLPARTLAALSGGSLRWDAESEAVEITAGERKAVFGAREGFVIRGDTGLLPVRAFAEAWDHMEYTADISRNFVSLTTTTQGE